jgi:hypothetical protein
MYNGSMLIKNKELNNMKNKSWNILKNPFTKKWVVVLKYDTKGYPYYVDYGHFDYKKDAVQFVLQQSK